MADFSLKEKVAVVTGSGSGIGKAISQEFASSGARVYVMDIDVEAAQATAQDLVEGGGWSAALACDVSSQKQVNQAFETIYQRAGKLDILVNNAGVASVGTAETTDEEDFDRVLRINVKGYYNCIHAVVGRMKKAGSGVILNMASVAASVGIQERFAYSTSKGAILAMTYQVARDYVSHGIRCNSISPARVHTPFVDGYLEENYAGREAEIFDELSRTQPIGRMGQPREVAALARYLCSDEASFITGTDFPLDGGFIRLQA